MKNKEKKNHHQDHTSIGWIDFKTKANTPMETMWNYNNYKMVFNQIKSNQLTECLHTCDCGLVDWSNESSVQPLYWYKLCAHSSTKKKWMCAFENIVQRIRKERR